MSLPTPTFFFLVLRKVCPPIYGFQLLSPAVFQHTVFIHFLAYCLFFYIMPPKGLWQTSIFFLLSEFFFHFSDHFFSISFAGFSSCTHLKMLGVFPGSIQITAGAPDPQMSQVQHIQNLTFLMNSQSQLSTLHLGSQVRNSSHER